MAKIVITIKDAKDGSCKVNMTLDPPIRKGKDPTTAQVLGVVALESVKAYMRRETGDAGDEVDE